MIHVEVGMSTARLCGLIDVPERTWRHWQAKARENYTDEFRRRAVELYESTPGGTPKGIAADLGVSRGALQEWVDNLGSATRAGGP